MVPYLAISLGILAAATGLDLGINKCDRCQHLCIDKGDGPLCFCRKGYNRSESDPTKCEPAKACGKGFQFSDELLDCVDIDECLPQNKPCQQQCRNSYGSYECSCDSGFTINEEDPTTCDQIDQCSVGKPCEHICNATPDGRICSCRPGYVVNFEDRTMCDDINECNHKPCEHICKDTEGSYVCSCKVGFIVDKNDNSKCIDINECNQNSCEQNCINIEGSYVCSCKDGFTLDKNDNSKCIDINECNQNPCEQNCTNTEGSYVCSCKVGFTLDKNDNSKCIAVPGSEGPENLKAASRSSSTLAMDVDECKGGICQHNCTNTLSSYEYSCRDGFAVEKIDTYMCREEVCKIKADVMLLFDSSASVGHDNFIKLLVFAESFTSKFNIGPDDVRFAAITFSRIPKLIFNLKDHSTTEALYKALSDVEYMGSTTHTHQAFLHIDKEHLFNAGKGGRGDARDIVILFTNGNPVAKDRARAAANKLKDNKVLILTVAIGSRLNVNVLKDISSAADDVVEAASYDTLDDVETRLKDRLCRAGKSADTRIAG